MKTKSLFVCIFAIAAASIFSSCEKVITLDLKNSDPLYVIEGENIHLLQYWGWKVEPILCPLK